MQYEEFKVLAKGLKSVYTADRFLPDADSIRVWFLVLKDLDYKVAEAACQKYIMTGKFPPTPADIRELANEITRGKLPDWGEAWEEVRKAVVKYGYMRPEEAYKALSPVTARVVQCLGWSDICESENPEVTKGQFRMAYETMAKRQREEASLPEALSETIKEIQQSTTLQIEGGEIDGI